jgi:hypothetical protein
MDLCRSQCPRSKAKICLLSLRRWDRGFESHSEHGYFVCGCVYFVFVFALRRLCYGLFTRPRSLPSVKKIIAEMNTRPGPWMGRKSHWKKIWIHIGAIQNIHIVHSCICCVLVILRNVSYYSKHNFFKTKMLTCNIISMHINFNFMTYTRIYYMTIMHCTNIDTN